MNHGDTIVSDQVHGSPANAGFERTVLETATTGDHPILAGKHFHLYETHTALRFDREAARAFRLNIPAGTTVRFKPGDAREIELVAIADSRESYGLNATINGQIL